MITQSATINRLLLILFSLVGFQKPVWSQSNWKENVLHYIHNSLTKPDGGYGWEDQPDAHLTPTFAVIGILHHIDQVPANRERLIHFVQTHHPQFGVSKEGGPSGTEERDLVYQQIQSIIWLGGNAADFKTKVSDWKPQFNKVSNFESHGYPVFIQEMMSPVCRQLLHISLADIDSFLTNYLHERRRPNGSFNNTQVKDGGDGNILNTYWGIYALTILGQKDSLKNETVKWLQSCQLKNGGFTHQPNPTIGANDDVAYTWAAVKALQLLSAKPANEKACIDYLLSLRNADGGFGKQAGQPSSPMSTYYAIDALKTLNAFSYLDKAKPVQKWPKKTTDFSGLKIFTVQFEAQGSGSPEEAVMLADSLQIQLWGAKNDHPGWIDTAQKIANGKKIPVTFFRSDEPYGKNVDIPGLGTFSHILDYIAPVQAAPLQLATNSSWQQFRSINVQALLNDGGALIWQVSNNEPLARMLLDETVKNGGYAGISTIHFGQNFLFWLPFLYQYRYQIPLIALQDAHGTEAWWWSNDLVSYRTLFLAKEPTYEEMMKALKNNWVVAVRHDSVSNHQTRMLGGAPGVQSFIKSKVNEWKWWTGDNSELKRPWAAITIVKPEDSLEVARPDKGVNIRIRCWWKTALYVLKEPVVQLEQLRIDHIMVKPEYVEEKDRRGQITDAYYLYSIKDASKGKHIIDATFRNLNTNKQQKKTLYFTVEK